MRHSWRDVLSALVALSLAVPTCAAPVDGEAAAARKEDLEFLYQTLERARPDLFANTPEERFLERKAAIETGLEEADDFTFALELQSLTALAGDSHTTLALGGSMSQTVHYYPMSLLHRDGSWYLSAVPAEHRALLGREITAVNGRSMEEIVEAFAAQVERDLSAGEYRRVVVDLRNNGGGSDGVIIPLLMELAPLVRSGELELWGLVGEATFSSASINALEIREMGGGLAGEPTSGSVDHFGSTGSFTLPNTEVRVSMSTKFIDTGTLLECAAGLGVEPIQPDVTVYQTLEDYLAGQDTLVDALCARTEPFQPQERPDAPLSRGRLTELLRQAAEQAGLDTQAPMQSLSDLLPCAWYAPGVCWALSSGVASGTGEAMFQASRPVTRQEGAAMVWQTARLLGMAPSGTAELTDAGSIASWALDAAQWAVSAGGLDTQNGAFHPQDTLTRAEGEALLSLLP